MAQTKIKPELIDGGLGTDWQSSIQTSNFTAAAGKGYFVDTTSGAVTVSLPAGNFGDEIHFTDYASNFDTNQITFSANGTQKILGLTINRSVSVKESTVRLVYQDDIKGWTGENISSPFVNVDFLVVAGGGGGGGTTSDGPGGGGAGGLRTSYGSSSGGGQSAETISTIAMGTNYTVTVGSGGSGGVGRSPGADGGDSIFNNITSTGGGGGGTSEGTVAEDTGRTGGSAGGSGTGLSATTRPSAAAVSNPIQGYAGGSSSTSSGRRGGGGGGAGEAGNTDGQGHGGDGLEVSITGSPVTYAGGGGGGYFGSSSFIPGGTGGGGDCPSGPNGNGDNGTANLGGGGGAAKRSGGGGSRDGGSGGSGVVILRYSNTKTLTASSGLTSTTATDGSHKVTTFTGGTGTISFS